MERAIEAAKGLLLLFGIVVGSQVAALAIGAVFWHLVLMVGALMIAHPSLSITAIIAFVKARRSGKGMDSAALEAGVEGAAKEALEKLFAWLGKAFT